MNAPWARIKPGPAARDDGSSERRGRRSMILGFDRVHAQGQRRKAVRHEVDPEDLDREQRHGPAEKRGDEHRPGSRRVLQDSR